MAIAGERIEFTGSQGRALAARFDRPRGPMRATALFAHCFTCSKDVFAASRISGRLAAAGFGVLRFDFTGLGASDGEFANTNFSSNIDDLVAAADWLRETHAPPALLIGHSLGGAAALAAATRMPEVSAVATIGAPADPAHVADLFAEQHDRIIAAGEAEVVIGGRPFRIQKQFLDDLERHCQAAAIARLGRTLMIFHSPVDAVVGIDNARLIYKAARHPKSFISLDDADHLLTRRADAVFVADVLGAWADRRLPRATPAPAPPGPFAEDAVVARETGAGRFQQALRLGRHDLFADEPVAFGGMDSGPSPYDLLAAALGACAAMTIRLYAQRKGLPLEGVSVAVSHEKIHAADCAACDAAAGRVDRFTRVVELRGALDAGQRRKLLEIADKCPVHRTLNSEVDIVTTLVGGDSADA